MADDSPLRSESFESVLAAAQAGSEWALTRLYRQHNPPVVRYLRANAGPDGDDLASQTWIDVARNLSSFTGTQDAFAGWVFTIARRRLIDHRRRLGRRREDSIDDQLLVRIQAEDNPSQLAVDVVEGDDAARRIVELLPARLAEIVLLRVLGGLSVAEVAEITGYRPGTVRVMQHRALRRLAKELRNPV